VSPAITPNDVPRRHDVPLGGSVGLLHEQLPERARPPRRCAGFQPSSLGASLVRESVGARGSTRGQTLTRTYVITATGRTICPRTSRSSSHQDPGLAKPVLVSNQQCDGARVLGGLPELCLGTELPRGIPVQLRASATLTNTANCCALHAVVSATGSVQTAEGPATGRTQYSFDSTSLGRWHSRSSPARPIAQGRLTRIANRTVFNESRTRPWSRRSSRILARRAVTPARASRSPRAHHHGTFAVISRPVRFDVDGVSYTATDRRDDIATVTSQPDSVLLVPHADRHSQEDAFFPRHIADDDIHVPRA